MVNEIIHECCGKPESQCTCYETEMHIKTIKEIKDGRTDSKPLPDKR
jgi:hypothetical protein